MLLGRSIDVPFYKARPTWRSTLFRRLWRGRLSLSRIANVLGNDGCVSKIKTGWVDGAT